MASLDSLSLQDLVALEKIISAVCKKYENTAQMNKTARNEVDQAEYLRATNSLSHYNKKRDVVLVEMENRINDLV